MKRLSSRTFIGWLTPVLAIVTMACQTPAFLSYNGQLSRPDNRLALENGGPYPAKWESLDLSLDFEYDKSPDRLTMWGHVALQNRNAKFPSIKQLRVNAHFLDNDGAILGTRTLYNPGYWVPMYLVNWQFERIWEIPPETVALAFSYSGTVGENGPRNGDDGGGVDWDFWKGP